MSGSSHLVAYSFLVLVAGACAAPGILGTARDPSSIPKEYNKAVPYPMADRKIQVCGHRLLEMSSMLCRGQYASHQQRAPVPHAAQGTQHVMADFIPRRQIRNVVDECCKQACWVSNFVKYCRYPSPQAQWNSGLASNDDETSTTLTVEPETQVEEARAKGPAARFFIFANLEPRTKAPANQPRPVLVSMKPRRQKHTTSNFKSSPLRIESDETERDRLDFLESDGSQGQGRGANSQGQGGDQFQGRLLSLPGYGTEQRLAGGPEQQAEVIHDHELSLDHDPFYIDRHYID